MSVTKRSRLNLDQLVQDHEVVMKDLLTLKTIGDRISRYGISITVVRHGHGATSSSNPMAIPSGKNIGSTQYWAEVHRIATERGISSSDARQVLRDRAKRTNRGRSPSRHASHASAN